MRFRVSQFLFGAAVILSRPLSSAAQTSMLWGENGEAWSPAGRLPDFSHAGYHAGRDPIPDVPIRVNVKDFGAAGDGIRDDSAAFMKALQSIREGAVWIPPGRYRLTARLILKNRIVLRGAGRN